jgi:hypothetical protein
MKTIRRTAVASAGALGLLAGQACGRLADDCEYMLDCAEVVGSSVADGGGGAGGEPSSGAGADGGGGAGGGSLPGNCDPELGGVEASCGVFVSSSMGDDESGVGAPDAPWKTLTKALSLVQTTPQLNRVYVCGEAFDEAVVVSSGPVLYGGLDCAGDWRHADMRRKTSLTAPAGDIPLRFGSGPSPAVIRDFAVTAAAAVSLGASSIAVLVDGASVGFERCALGAGTGADGPEGLDAPALAEPPQAQADSGADACTNAAAVAGAGPTSNDCAGTLSIGGAGGDGSLLVGAAGAPGEPALGGGQAGTGEPAGGAWSCVSGQGLGAAGSAGEVGAAGKAGTDQGSLSATGYLGTPGGAGALGGPAQGGGGGGGAKGQTGCAGASGGAGGAGGCGGLPGGGGGPGGASFALVSIGAVVSLSACTLVGGAGGKGGGGGDPQPGAPGGLPGAGGTNANLPGLKSACAGGLGGLGGTGGAGAGGRGGPSAAIAQMGSAIDASSSTLSFGAPGAGGPGGSENVASNAGTQGSAADVLIY